MNIENECDAYLMYDVDVEWVGPPRVTIRPFFLRYYHEDATRTTLVGLQTNDKKLGTLYVNAYQCTFDEDTTIDLYEGPVPMLMARVRVRG